MNENSSEVKIRIVIKLIHNTYTVLNEEGRPSCVHVCVHALKTYSHDRL